MSDALRELIVSIDFNDVDISKLTRVDQQLNSVENSFRDVGADIGHMGTKMDSTGADAVSTLNKMERKTDDVGDAMKHLGKSTDIDNLTATLDNVNGRLAMQEKKLRDLRRSLDAAFDDDKRDHLQRQILATESSILSLRKQSDRTAKAIWTIDDAMKNTAQEATHLGDVGGKALKELETGGHKAAGGSGKLLNVLNDVVPAGRSAGMASMLFSNPWVAAGVAVVAAIGGVSLALMHMSNETDKAMDRIKALTGTSGEELKGLQDVTKNVFNANFGDSLGGVGEDVAKLHGQFKDLNNVDLQKLAEGAYIIKDLWGADVSETGRAVKTMTDNFKGLSEAKALDLITFAFQNGGDYAADLMDTLKEYSPYFSKMGMDAQKMVGILLKGADAGAWNLDKVADAVKEFGIRSIDGSKGTSDAFKALGFDSKKMAKDIAVGGGSANNAFMATVASLSFVDDQVKQNQLGVQLFGTQWEDVRQDVIFAMDGAETAVAGFEGTTKKAGDAMYDNMGAKWEEIKRTIGTGLGDAFGGSNGGVGADFLDGIIAKLPQIKQGIQDFADWFQGIFAPGSPAYLYLQGFQSFWTGVWDVIQGVWNLAGPFLTASIGGTLNLIWTIAGTTLGAIGDIFTIFGDVLQGDWSGAWQGVKDLFSGIMTGLQDNAMAALDLLYGVFNSSVGRITELLFGWDLAETGQHIIAGLVAGVTGAKQWAIDAFNDLYNGIWEGITGYFGIASPSTLMMEAGQWIIEGLKDGVLNRAKGAIAAIKNVAEDMWFSVKDFFGIASPAELTIEAGGFIVDGMTVGISDSAIGAVNAARNMAKDIANAAQPSTVNVTPLAPSMASAASAQAPAGQSGGVTISMPITVQAGAAASAEEAEDIGRRIGQEVESRLAALFTQLNIKFAN